MDVNNHNMFSMKGCCIKKHLRIPLFFSLVVCILALPFVFGLENASAAESASSSDLLKKGKALYQKDCATCHGTKGKGKGKAGANLYPKPRDFTTGVFKIRSTPTLPTDEDLFRSIKDGMAGTLMPSFKHLSRMALT